MWLFNKRIVFYLIIVKCIFLFIIYILHSFSLSVNKRTKQQYKGNYNSKNKQSVYYLFHTITLLCQIGIWHSVKLKFSIAYNDMNLFLVSLLYLIKLSFVASKSFTYIAICSILIITTANFIFYSCFICNSTISFILKNSFSYFG